MVQDAPRRGSPNADSSSLLTEPPLDDAPVVVGEPEADAKKGKISITSPLARALIGKAKGTSVEVVTPSGAKAYAIKKIEWR